MAGIARGLYCTEFKGGGLTINATDGGTLDLDYETAGTPVEDRVADQMMPTNVEVVDVTCRVRLVMRGVDTVLVIGTAAATLTAKLKSKATEKTFTWTDSGVLIRRAIRHTRANFATGELEFAIERTAANANATELAVA